MTPRRPSSDRSFTRALATGLAAIGGLLLASAALIHLGNRLATTAREG